MNLLNKFVNFFRRFYSAIVSYIKNNLYNFLLLSFSIIFGWLFFSLETNYVENQKFEKIIGLKEAWQLNASRTSGEVEPEVLKKLGPNIKSIYESLEYLFYNPGGKNRENTIVVKFDQWAKTLATGLISNDNLDSILISQRIDSGKGSWKILREDVNYESNQENAVNYGIGQLIKCSDSVNLNNIERAIFLKFITLIKSDLGFSEKDTLNFEQYNDKVLTYFLGKDLKKDIPLIKDNIRVHRFYIASRIKNNDSLFSNDTILRKIPYYGNMVIYPAHVKEKFDIKPWTRHWWKAAFDENIPVNFFNQEDDVYGDSSKKHVIETALTSQYNDVQGQNVSLLVRTFYSYFRVRDIEFVFCLDFFLTNRQSVYSQYYMNDDSYLPVSKASVGPLTNFWILSSVTDVLVSWGVLTPLSNWDIITFCVIDTVIFIIIFFIIGLSLKKITVNRIIKKITKQETNDFITYKFERLERFDISSNSVVTYTSDITLDKKVKNIKEESSEFQFTIPGFDLFSHRNSQNSIESFSKNFESKIFSTQSDNLGVNRDDYYRSIEYWEVYSSIKNSLAKKPFVIFKVKWLNTVFTQGELSIDTVVTLAPNTNKLDNKKERDFIKSFEKLIVLLKEKLEMHLLAYEGKTFETEVTKNELEKIEYDIPNDILDIRVGGRTVKEYYADKGKNISERKINFKESDDEDKDRDRDYNFFLKFYENADIKAVCGIQFLKGLKNKGKLYDFFKRTYDVERYFIESQEEEFYNFYQENKDDFRELDKNSFRIWKFNSNNDDLDKRNIYVKYDFAIAEKKDFIYILFSYASAPTKEIGWVSWREVDKNFYEYVFDEIKRNIDKESLNISDYLKMIEQNDQENL